MDAVKFIKERNRMCKSFGGSCDNCPADRNTCCDAFEWQEELVAIVEEWSSTHPSKTRQSVFLEQWPKARIDTDGVLCACPINFVYNHPCFSGFNSSGCSDCRREFWSQEVE